MNSAKFGTRVEQPLGVQPARDQALLPRQLIGDLRQLQDPRLTPAAITGRPAARYRHATSTGFNELLAEARVSSRSQWISYCVSAIIAISCGRERATQRFHWCCQDEGMRIELTLDCLDLDAVAAFWRAALGYAPEGTIGGRYVALTGDGPGLTLQRVSESKRGKSRLHLDLLVDDVDSEVARLRALGATMVTPVAREEFGQRWFVLADVEGNEFCVAKDASDGTDGGA